MFLLVATLTVLLSILLKKMIAEYRRTENLTRNISNPMGFSHYNYRRLIDARDTCLDLCEFCYKYKNFMKVRIFHYFAVFVYNPEHVEKVFRSSQIEHKSDIYGPWADAFFGKGILGAEDLSVWKSHRKIMAPAFSQTKVNKHVKTFSECTKNLIQNLEDFVKHNYDKQIDIASYTTNSAAQALGLTLFDFDFVAEEPKVNQGERFEDATSILFQRIFWPISYFKVLYYWTDTGKKETKLIREIEQLLSKAMKAGIANFKSADDSNNMMDLLVAELLNGNITEDDLIQEAKTFYLTGIDTNALTTGYALMLLGMNPEIQEKLYEEVIDILGPDRPVELADLSDLKYTECVIKETMRIFPTAPLFAREAQEDIYLEDGATIPKGATAAINLLALHRNEDYWPDPLKFDPDRFLPENSSNRHPYSYIPFSAGPRNCIGTRYAMNFLKVVLPMVIRKFRVKCSYKRIEDIKIKCCVSSMPFNGFGVTLELR